METAEIRTFRGQHEHMSNFHRGRPIIIDGIEYPTAEHAYQAHKTTDEAQRRAIAQMPNARDAKRAGRRLTLRDDWDTQSVAIMTLIVTEKYRDPQIRAQLIATGDATITEGNLWHDQIWGDCRCGRRKACERPGANNLGRILMQIRAQAQAEAQAE